MFDFNNLPQLELEPGMEVSSSSESASGAVCSAVDSVETLIRMVVDIVM